MLQTQIDSVMPELWGVCSTPSLPSLPGPLWRGVVTPYWVKLNCLTLKLSANKCFMLN